MSSMYLKAEMRCDECGRDLYCEFKHTWDGVQITVPPCKTCIKKALMTEPPQEEEANDVTD